MISVAMATYNSQKYIIRQLESIKQQTKQVDEVIIQDDNSTDNTIDLIKDFINKYNLSNWKIEKNTTNIGYILTFKKAINRCIGDIIILSDHDDVWLENKVEIIENEFKKNENILVLATSFVEIDEKEQIIPIKKRITCSNNNLIKRRVRSKKINKMSIRDIGVYNISPGCTCAFNSKIKEKLIKENYDLPHDWQITSIGALMNGLYYLDIVTTKYRIHSNNTIGLGHKDDYSTRLKLSKKALTEKKELKRLFNTFGLNNKDRKYINRVVEIFYLREKLMNSKNILKYGINILIKSIGLGKLYESVGFDILSIIKIYKSKRRETI